jgi:plastocyanin
MVCSSASIAIVLIGQNPPAPTVDRVGFPTDYQHSMAVLYVYDRPDNKSVRTIYANAPVFTVTNANQNNYPYGSVVVMETWSSLKDSLGNPILDANGRFQKDPAATPTVFVMRKEKGFGADYGPNRTGEWEYVAYHPDGTYQTTPQNSFSCAICHLQAGQGKDWVFRAALHEHGASGAMPAGVIKSYTFVPNTMHVKAGSAITIYNDDVIAHTIVDDSAGGFSSQPIPAGSSIELQFPNVPFEWDFHCAIHPGMVHGKIIVDPK